ncbi:MAG: metalloregulator ArsR/SmtB family transcription factor [Patescibacteria group bacterium]|jgi:ArsR family transcriptional regulator|nr:metalloregulator ArsR/SmtB family transcription factor [Patescibacteria group bacterium]
MNMRSYNNKTIGCSCKVPELNQKDFSPTSDYFRKLKAISVPSKLAILFTLRKAPHCVCDLEKHTGLSQTLISHHLTSFSNQKLVAAERRGTFIEYRLTDKGRKLVESAKQLL